MLGKSVDGKLTLNVEKLKNMRRQHGLSQEALARRCVQERLCLSLSTIKRAELGKRVSYRTAGAFAQLYGVSVDSIVSQTFDLSMENIGYADRVLENKRIEITVSCTLFKAGSCDGYSGLCEDVMNRCMNQLHKVVNSASSCVSRFIYQEGGSSLDVHFIPSAEIRE